jgi:hypothetical protein
MWLHSGKSNRTDKGSHLRIFLPNIVKDTVVGLVICAIINLAMQHLEQFLDVHEAIITATQLDAKLLRLQASGDRMSVHYWLAVLQKPATRNNRNPIFQSTFALLVSTQHRFAMARWHVLQGKNTCILGVCCPVEIQDTPFDDQFPPSTRRQRHCTRFQCRQSAVKCSSHCRKNNYIFSMIYFIFLSFY